MNIADKKKISIVIPIYNEEGTLRALWDRLYKIVSEWNYDTEIIFVNDGSKDASLSILHEFVTKFPSVAKVISLSRNFGHQPALTAGLEYAAGDGIIMMDGDLQDTPETLPKFAKKWEEGYEVVYAIRTKRKEFFLKKIAFSLFYRVQSCLINIPLPLDAGIFSLMDKKVLDVLKSMPEQNRYISGLRGFVGYKQTGIEVERGERYEGDPKVKLINLIKLALDGILSMSYIPLRLASFFGFFIAIISFLITLVVLYIKIFTNKASPGWASNLSVSFFMGGVQLIFLGIIGEYLGRIYDEVKKRPYYIVGQKLGFSDNDTPDNK